MQMVTNDEIVARLDELTKERLAQLRFEHSQLQEQWNRARDVRVYAAASKPPEATYVLARGSTTSPMYEVPPGGISAIGDYLPSSASMRKQRMRTSISIGEMDYDERNPSCKSDRKSSLETILWNGPSRDTKRFRI